MLQSTLFLLSLILIFSCNSNNSKTSTEKQEKWSVRMANSVMHISDTLQLYEQKNYPEKNYSQGEWDYDVAYMGAAIAKLDTVDKKYFNYMKDYIDHFVQEDGSVMGYQKEEYNIDRISPARNIITLYNRTKEEKYKIAMEQFVDQMRTHPKTDSGGYWHKNIYPNQMWLDGLYMGSPFLAEYAKEFNHPEWFNVITHQFLLVYKKTYDPKTGLLHHAQDESRQQKWADPITGRSEHFWGRSIGWYLMGIVDVMDYLPEDHPDRETILTHFKTTIDAVLKVRDKESGVWYQILDMPDKKGNYLEGSCSAMFTYAIAKGANKGYLDESYKTIANNCFDSVIKSLITIGEDGYLTLENVCGGAGLGGNPYRDGSFEYYVSEPIVPNDCKGVAAFIDAALELGR